MNDSEKHAFNQQVITACAFIHKEFDGIQKLFLPKRALSKKFLPGVFELPGGHIEFGEDIVTGLRREIMEELGLEIKIGDPFYVFTYTNEVKGSHSIEVIYFAQFKDEFPEINLNPKDHSEYVWIDAKSVEQLLFEGKTSDDPEIKAIIRGFELIKDKNLKFS